MCDFWPQWVSGSLSVKLSEIFLPCAEATLAPPTLPGFYFIFILFKHLSAEVLKGACPLQLMGGMLSEQEQGFSY